MSPLVEVKSMEQLLELGKPYADRFDGFLRQFGEMTHEQVLLVIEARVLSDWSWRTVAQVWVAKYGAPDPRYFPLDDSQVLGMALCKIAAARVGADYMKEPWN